MEPEIMKWATCTRAFSWIRFGVSRIWASQREMHKQSKLTFRFYPVSNAVATAFVAPLYIYRYVWT